MKPSLVIMSGFGTAFMTFFMGLTIVITTLITVSLVSIGQLGGAFIALVFLGVIALF